VSPSLSRLILPEWEVTGRIVRADDIQYHQARAARELDAGRLASCANAARAHVTLSELHMERARVLGAIAAKPVTDE
jgi:hypothetical protein